MWIEVAYKPVLDRRRPDTYTFPASYIVVTLQIANACRSAVLRPKILRSPAPIQEYQYSVMTVFLVLVLENKIMRSGRCFTSASPYGRRSDVIHLRCPLLSLNSFRYKLFPPSRTIWKTAAFFPAAFSCFILFQNKTKTSCSIRVSFSSEFF